MKSSKTFDDVIQYLEKTIVDGGEIDYNEISKIAMSPAALFQRIFIFISGVSIADYVRKRKLTMAGLNLKNSDISVLDVAIKYGFQSHSAFSRAFKEHHGITPSEAKLETANLNIFLPINYLEMRFIGGKRIMAEMKKIIYKEAEERLMIGMHTETSFFEAGKVWQAFFEGDTPEKLSVVSDVKRCDDIEENAGIGMMYNFKDMNNFELVIGDFVQVDTQIPEGLYSKHVPGGLTAHIQIEGNQVPDIVESAYLLITEAVEKTGKQIDHENFYWCEVYTNERYCEPSSRGEKVTIDYIVPIKAESN
jgi:AraC family transcriptional regulator